MKYFYILFFFFQNILIAGVSNDPPVLSDTGKVFNRIEDKVFTTKSGKSFIINIEQESKFLYNAGVTGIGFPGSSDTILFDEIEHLDTVVVADIDSDGFEELYIFTKGFLPGEFDHVFGVASIEDKYYCEITFPGITEEDIKSGGIFEGYNGKDVYKIKNNILERTFPVHKNADTYENPQSGYKTIYYTLEKNASGCFFKIRK